MKKRIKITSRSGRPEQLLGYTQGMFAIWQEKGSPGLPAQIHIAIEDDDDCYAPVVTFASSLLPDLARLTAFMTRKIKSNTNDNRVP